MGEKCDQNLQDLEQHLEKEMETTWSLPSLCGGTYLFLARATVGTSLYVSLSQLVS